MNKVLRFHPLAENVRVQVTGDMPPLPPALDGAVEAIWGQEQRRLDGALFNGRVFSADTVTPERIEGHWTEFRRIVAQMRDPALHPQLAIRPLAVCGLIIAPEGVVFGRRPERSVYQAGEWQLPPAGSVDPSAARDDGTVDVMDMLMTELDEELGLAQHQVADPTPIGIVEHAGSHVLDLGIALRTSLSAQDLQAAHARRGNGEYASLVIVAHAEIDAFLAQPDVTLQAEPLLRHAARLLEKWSLPA